MRWADTDQRDKAAIGELLESTRLDVIATHPVSCQVNSPRNDDPFGLEGGFWDQKLSAQWSEVAPIRLSLKGEYELGVGAEAFAAGKPTVRKIIVLGIFWRAKNLEIVDQNNHFCAAISQYPPQPIR